ncbi:MAG: hypothetical protein COA42_22565 [Alteromonadaceae bacterium]|nr:MAG: hypothetical protein COA42_22565 [Alteromonadaceae bacterium]
MKKSNHRILIAAITTALTAVASQQSHAVPDQPAEWEKCAGIVKAGQNDCGALDGSHVCSGQSTVDNGKSEWAYLPAGICDKLTGGIVSGKKPAKLPEPIASATTAKEA